MHGSLVTSPTYVNCNSLQLTLTFMKVQTICFISKDRAHNLCANVVYNYKINVSHFKKIGYSFFSCLLSRFPMKTLRNGWNLKSLRKGISG